MRVLGRLVPLSFPVYFIFFLPPVKLPDPCLGPYQ